MKAFMLGTTVLVALFFCAAFPLSAENYRETPESYQVDVLVPSKESAYKRFQQLMESGHSQYAKQIQLMTSLDKIPGKTAKKHLLITIGPSPLADAAKEKLPYDAVIAFYISPDDYRKTLEQFRAKNPRLPVTAVYSTAPPERHLLLATLLMPHAKKIGVLYHKEDLATIRKLEGTASAMGVGINSLQVDNDSPLTPQVAKLLRSSDLLLALDEGSIIHPGNIRNVLLATYRQRKPVIGLTKPYIQAGVMATTYSTIDEYAMVAEKIIRHYDRHGFLPSPSWANHFHIATNKQVARSLGFTLPQPSEIESIMNNGRHGNE